MGTDDIEKNAQKPDSAVTENAVFQTQSLRGGLYIVATPIGNLRDITLRALDVLQAADIVLCEDTRVTGKLLAAYQIKARLRSYNDHSDDQRRDMVAKALDEGRVVALVSDAGMPLISDPGYKLVRACAGQGHYVTTVPGANAPLSALQLSALPSDQFCFLGFLPNKMQARQNFLKPWAEVPATLIAFETAPRLKAALSDIHEILGAQREVAVVREITKLYEEVKRGIPGALISYYEAERAPKGEIVLVIAPPRERVYSEDEVIELIRSELEVCRTKEAASRVSDITGWPKKDLYNMALRIVKEGA